MNGRLPTSSAMIFTAAYTAAHSSAVSRVMSTPALDGVAVCTDSSL